MFIELKNIQALFGEYNTRLESDDYFHCLTNYCLIAGAVKPYTNHLLYVAQSIEELKQCELLPSMHVLLLTDDSPENIDLKVLSNNICSVLILQMTNVSRVLELLRDYFNDRSASGLFAESLLEILYSETGIQYMIDKTYPAFENPIYVFDTGFHLIAANWEYAEQTEMGRRLIENRGFSLAEFKLVNTKQRIHEKVKKSETPILVHHKEVGFDQLVCAIDNKKDIGHIVVSAVNRPFIPLDYELLQLLKKGIDQQMKQDVFIRNNKGFHYEFFLRDLLEGKIATGKQYLDRLSFVETEFKGTLYCMVIEVARSSSTLNILHIRSHIEQEFPDSKTLMYNGQIIIILRFPKNRTMNEKHQQKAKKICKDYLLFAGISNNFEKILDIPEYYKQALRALEMGICDSEDPTLFFYKDYYMQHMANIFMQKESSQTFCHPKMKNFLEYDKNHETNLSYTLYMYLLHERNSSAAATAMSIHRNTMIYRLKKIDSLETIHYEDYAERQYLILSYELYKNS